ncbi:hypothetical protein ABN584_00450 [Gloeocapsa sp. BRSZ]
MKDYSGKVQAIARIGHCQQATEDSQFSSSQILGLNFVTIGSDDSRSPFCAWRL